MIRVSDGQKKILHIVSLTNTRLTLFSDDKASVRASLSAVLSVDPWQIRPDSQSVYRFSPRLTGWLTDYVCMARYTLSPELSPSGLSRGVVPPFILYIYRDTFIYTYTRSACTYTCAHEYREKESHREDGQVMLDTRVRMNRRWRFCDLSRCGIWPLLFSESFSLFLSRIQCQQTFCARGDLDGLTCVAEFLRAFRLVRINKILFLHNYGIASGKKHYFAIFVWENPYVFSLYSGSNMTRHFLHSRIKI